MLLYLVASVSLSVSPHSPAMSIISSEAFHNPATAASAPARRFVLFTAWHCRALPREPFQRVVHASQRYGGGGDGCRVSGPTPGLPVVACLPVIFRESL